MLTSISLPGVESHGISVKDVTLLTDVNSLNYILIVPKGGKEILKVDRAYVESKCAWREQMDRASRWMTDKTRNVPV